MDILLFFPILLLVNGKNWDASVLGLHPGFLLV